MADANGTNLSSSQSSFTFKPTTLKEFESVFPSLVEDLTQQCKAYNLPGNALKWFQDVRFLYEHFSSQVSSCFHSIDPHVNFEISS